jgi:hypothetical protein
VKPSLWRQLLAWALQLSILVTSLLVFAQAVLAGQFMSGDSSALAFHEMNGTEIIEPAIIVQTLLSILVWRPGRGPWWPVVWTLVVFGALFLQITYGFERRLQLHVPLGVAILAALVMMLTATRGISRGMVPKRKAPSEPDAPSEPSEAPTAG